MKLLGTLLLGSSGRLAATTFAGVISGASTTALIVIVNRMIHQRGVCSPGLVGLFVCLCIIRLSAGLLSHAWLVRLSQDAIYDLRMGICRGVMAAPLRDLEKLGITRLRSAFSDDLLHIATAVVNLPYTFVNVIILLGCFIYLGWLSPPALVWMVPCVGVGALTYSFATGRANALLRKGREECERLSGHFRELFQGAKELKLHSPRRAAFFDRALEECADRVRGHQVRGITIYSAAANWSRLLFFVYVGLMILRPLSLPISRPNDVAGLAACVIVILYMMAPLEAILNSWPYLAQAEVALANVKSLSLQLEPESISPCQINSPVSASWRTLRLIDIQYTYGCDGDSRDFVLGPVSLAIEPGQITFLVGDNGSGKTTLGKLIAGLYKPDLGDLLLDGAAINGSTRERYRALFSAVFNDFHLFDSLLGIDPAQLALADHYLRQMNLASKVRVYGDKLSTTDLSQGQRKRLALLVALLEDRDIYLFDEWAADQDPQFKRVFYQVIIPHLKAQGKAVVLITHDDRYFDLADQLYRIQDGRVSLTRSAAVPAESASR